jgi:ubiquinone/menaquinone biosynthesis C-methylase UbiE
MDHSDHVALLREGVEGGGAVWADFGSGDGAFTLALADLLGSAGRIYSVDRERNTLERQVQALRRCFPATQVTYRQADFAHSLGLPPLDGIVMANALHFTRDKTRFSPRSVGHDSLRPSTRGEGGQTVMSH